MPVTKGIGVIVCTIVEERIGRTSEPGRRDIAVALQFKNDAALDEPTRNGEEIRDKMQAGNRLYRMSPTIVARLAKSRLPT